VIHNIYILDRPWNYTRLITIRPGAVWSTFRNVNGYRCDAGPHDVTEGNCKPGWLRLHPGRFQRTYTRTSYFHVVADGSLTSHRHCHPSRPTAETRSKRTVRLRSTGRINGARGADNSRAKHARDSVDRVPGRPKSCVGRLAARFS